MKIEIYKDKRGEWRWRLKARNGRIICVASEGYKKPHSLLKSLKLAEKFFSKKKFEVEK